MKALSIMMLAAAMAAPAVLSAGKIYEWVPKNLRGQAQADKFEAKIVKVEGDASNIVIELPDGTTPTAAEGLVCPQGTVIATGEGEQVIFALEGTQNGKPFQNSMLSVRPGSEVRLDTLAVQGDSVVSRVAMTQGEVRIKVTEERQDFSTDMKVATPNATASVTGTDVTQFGFNANKGTYAAVAQGSLLATRKDGTGTKIGGGSSAGDKNSALDQALQNATRLLAPLGMNVFEVAVGQLAGGPERFGSDNNNPATNPNLGRGVINSELAAGDRGDTGQPLPATGGRTDK